MPFVGVSHDCSVVDKWSCVENAAIGVNCHCVTQLKVYTLKVILFKGSIEIGKMLSMIEPDKTFIFQPHLKCSADLVRTGVIGDGNCFFHAFLRASRSGYKRASMEEKLAMVKEVREKIAATITRPTFQAHGELMRMLFFTELNRLLSEFALHTDTTLTVKEYEKIVHTSIQSDNFYYTFCTLVQEQTGQDRSVIFTEMFTKAHDQAYESFVSSIRTMGSLVESVHLPFITQALHKNFLFIDGTTLEPYPASTIYDPSLKSIVMLWVDEAHYEIVGKLLPESIIQRIFTDADEVVQALIKTERSRSRRRSRSVERSVEEKVEV